MQDVFDEIINVLARGEIAALSTIVSSKGSLPMSKKAKMLVRHDGTFAGTVGGGCLEADVWAEARRVMTTGTPSLQRFILTEKHAGEEGLNCGGNVEIFTEPIGVEPLNEVFEAVCQLRKNRGTALLATLVAGERTPGGRKMMVTDTGETVGTLGSSWLDERVREERDRVISEDVLTVFSVDRGEVAWRIFMEAILPPPQLFLFGGGHVSRAIARIAKTVGFRIVVIDDRPSFANRERFPEADEVVVEEFDDVVGKLSIDPSSYLVAVTRGHQWDQTVIEQAVWTPARYIGMIGSRRKITLMWKKLEEKGVPRHLLDGIYAPVGLDIHADTPEEIAVSIVAQLIQVRRAKGKPAHTVPSLALSPEIKDSI
ncbi:MAG: XdhC family protein [candidate division Zixibacteria bacterium]|nr:XdhC family protein [candidate division Zixibacteria bacterium]